MTEALAAPFEVLLDEPRTQFEAFIEAYRSAIEATLADLSEEQVRRRQVASSTTLMGLVKHVTWMQRIWFEQCVGDVTRDELGLVSTPEESFTLDPADTIPTVVAAHQEACATARAAVAGLPLDTIVSGHPSGPRTLHWVYLQVLRELAHHCGHADILREQILDAS